MLQCILKCINPWFFLSTASYDDDGVEDLSDFDENYVPDSDDESDEEEFEENEGKVFC